MNNCRVCNVELTDGNWFASLKKKNSSICKKCNNDKMQKWREDNRDRANAMALKHYYKNPKIHHERVKVSRGKLRVETLKAYGGSCCHCGTSDFDVLDIDHIENDGAKERRENLFAYNLYRKLKKENYPKERYQVLCKNCNWKKELKRRSGI